MTSKQRTFLNNQVEHNGLRVSTTSIKFFLILNLVESQHLPLGSRQSRVFPLLLASQEDIIP